MDMVREITGKRLLAVMGTLVLVGMLALAAGCGKKPPVVTEAPPEPTPQTTEPLPPPPTPEPEAKPAPAPDYAAMEPREYGIEDVFFAFDVYQLSDDAMATLAANARIMKEHADLTWLIEGHCDERGTVEYNLALGEKRAATTRDYLTTLGIPAGHLKIVSYGEERPFAAGHNETAWSQNRRAHFARPHP